MSKYLNPCLVHPVALAINKKNETPLFAAVFVVLSTLLHVSAYIGHLQVLHIQNVKKKLPYVILTDPSLLHTNKSNISKIV
jgi:hypothetical protein